MAGMMITTLLLIVLTVSQCLLTDALSASVEIDTAVKRQPPGLKSPVKLWWAKEITPDFHVAGRLTERQIKYAAEGGFRSVLSLFIYEEGDVGNFGGQRLPTTAEAWVASHAAGLQYVGLLGPQDDWASVAAVQKLDFILPTLKRPILLHCDRGYTITFVTLMYMANQTRYNPDFEPKIYSDNFYKITAAMGLDFTHEHTREVVAEITGEDIVENPPKHSCEPEEWLDFWLAHPVSRNWYSSGQIRSCDIKMLQEIGFRAVVNMRLGTTHNNEPSQEAVTLLNIRDGTPTYGNKTLLPRQDLKTLEASKINSHHRNDYIADKSKVNYEAENRQEFGDDVGYNEKLEREHFVKSNLKYYHIPIPPDANYSVAMFQEVRDTLLEAGQLGPVLLHCDDGRRVVYFAVLAAAIQEGKDLKWALKRSMELGFEVSPDVRPDVYKMYCSSLGVQEGPSEPERKEEL